MIIIRPKLLREFRGPGFCEWCKKFCRRREPHHIFGRGMGGGQRLDVRIGLISLGASLPFPECTCHGDIHAGHILKCDLLLIVAVREDEMQHHIEEVIYWLRRLPKMISDAEIARRVAELSPGAESLAERTLIEAWVGS